MPGLLSERAERTSSEVGGGGSERGTAGPSVTSKTARGNNRLLALSKKRSPSTYNPPDSATKLPAELTRTIV